MNTVKKTTKSDPLVDPVGELFVDSGIDVRGYLFQNAGRMSQICKGSNVKVELQRGNVIYRGQMQKTIIRK